MFEQFTETTVGLIMVLPESETGVYFSLIHYDNGYGNPMAMPWDVWDDKENVELDTVLGYKREEYKEIDTSFVGIDFSGFCGIGGGIKIGFNIPTESINKFAFML